MITKLKQSGRVCWTEGIGWLPAQVGQRRRGLQSVFQVEGEIISSSTLVFCTESSYWLTWEPLSESLWCWQKTKDIGVIKRTWDCISLWPMLFPGYSYSFSYSWCFQGTGEFINTRFFCRVCALMHNTQVCIHQHHLGQLVLIIIILVIIWMILNHISPTLDTLLTYVSLGHVYKVTCMNVNFLNFHDQKHLL